MHNNANIYNSCENKLIGKEEWTRVLQSETKVLMEMMMEFKESSPHVGKEITR